MPRAVTGVRQCRPKTAISVDRAAAMHPVPGRDPGCWPVAAPGSPATARPCQRWPASLYSAPFRPSRASESGTKRAAMSASVSGCCRAQASSAWRVACVSLAWQARRRSSSRLRGVGPGCSARCTAGWRRACSHRPKPIRVLSASSAVLSCHGQSTACSAGTADSTGGSAAGGEIRIVRDIQRTRLERGALQAIFDGVPPDDFESRQLQWPAAGGDQGFALFATANQAG